MTEGAEVIALQRCRTARFQRAIADVAAELHAVEGDLLDRVIGLFLRRSYRVAERGDTQYASAIGHQIIRDDYTGKIEVVNSALLKMLLHAGYLPVIAPVAVSEKGEALNVDADRAAAMVASALKAETLLLLTAVPGLMKNFPDESTLIRQLPQSQLLMAGVAAQGRMKKKILGAEEALKGGVSRVIIADGRIQNPISNALSGNGTIIQCTAL